MIFQMNEKNNIPPFPMTLKEMKLMFESGKNPMSYMPYAEGLRASGALAQALEICRAGLDKKPDSVSGRTLLAKILYDMGRYDNALEELGNVLQHAHEAYGANLLMAKILAKKREYHDAYDIVNSIKSMNPTDTDLLEIERFLHSQIFSMETRADLSDKRISSVKPRSLDTRINELLQQLEVFPGVLRFGFSKLPEEDKEMADADPARQYFLQVRHITAGKNLGVLKHVLLEMEKGSLFMLYVEGALLQIFIKKDANIGMLRLQVDKILNP